MFTPPYECVSCKTTKMRFDKLEIPYTVVEADDEIVKQLRSDGFAQFPVVRVDCGDDSSWSWSGFRYNDICRLAQLFVGG